MKRIEYWTLFKSGSVWSLCSVHKTAAAARKEADECEKRGGTKHTIAEVRHLPRRKP